MCKRLSLDKKTQRFRQTDRVIPDEVLVIPGAKKPKKKRDWCTTETVTPTLLLYCPTNNSTCSTIVVRRALFRTTARIRVHGYWYGIRKVLCPIFFFVSHLSFFLTHTDTLSLLQLTYADSQMDSDSQRSSLTLEGSPLLFQRSLAARAAGTTDDAWRYKRQRRVSRVPKAQSNRLSSNNKSTLTMFRTCFSGRNRKKNVAFFHEAGRVELQALESVPIGWAAVSRYRTLKGCDLHNWQ